MASFGIFLLFLTLVLPRQSAQTQTNLGDNRSPDLSFLYTPNELYNMAEAYGEQGRNEYIQARFTFDLIWPLVYTLYLSTAISWIFKGTSLLDGHGWWINLIPIFAMAFDFLENITTSLVMYRYPASTNFLAAIAPVLTAIKWISVAVSFVILIIGAIIVIRHTYRLIRGIE
jgi:hypothetical protein